MQPKLRVISLGWGVQSFTLAAMSALGELPPVDFAIHSDTTWERAATYEFARQWTPWLEERGVKMVTVSDQGGTAFDGQANNSGGIFIPAFTVSAENRVYGQLRRQCTQRWKIAPMQRFISQALKRVGVSKTAGVVEQWLGISLDEWTRAKDSNVKYIRNVYPLLDLRMTRQDCLEWLTAHDLPSPGKSSCTFCPYHNAKTWEVMKLENGPDWEQALTVDAAIRNIRPPYPLFVHAARKPLEEAVTIPEDFGASQLELLAIDDEVPCDSGHCFL